VCGCASALFRTAGWGWSADVLFMPVLVELTVFNSLWLTYFLSFNSNGSSGDDANLCYVWMLYFTSDFAVWEKNLHSWHKNGYLRELTFYCTDHGISFLTYDWRHKIKWKSLFPWEQMNITHWSLFGILKLVFCHISFGNLENLITVLIHRQKMVLVSLRMSWMTQGLRGPCGFILCISDWIGCGHLTYLLWFCWISSRLVPKIFISTSYGS
jgi:hypothetical protein